MVPAPCQETLELTSSPPPIFCAPGLPEISCDTDSFCAFCAATLFKPGSISNLNIIIYIYIISYNHIIHYNEIYIYIHICYVYIYTLYFIMIPKKIDRKVGTLDFVFNLIYAIYTLSWKHICVLWGLRSEARESKRLCCRLTRRRSSWRSWFGLSARVILRLRPCITV